MTSSPLTGMLAPARGTHRKEEAMSAFIVKDETINKIVTFLQRKAHSNTYWPSDLIKHAGYNLQEQKEAMRLATEMFQLNVHTVEERYPNVDPSDFRDLNFQFKIVSCPMMHAYKALECWRYQCNEGTVPQSFLYTLMDRVMFAMAHTMVTNMPEYANAPWS